MYLVTSPLRHNRKEYGVGMTVELSDEHAEPLLKVGAIQPHATTTESVNGKAPAADDPAAGAEPNGSGVLTQTQVGAAKKAKAPKAAAGKSAKPSAPKPQAKPTVTGEK